MMCAFFALLGRRIKNGDLGIETTNKSSSDSRCGDPVRYMNRRPHERCERAAVSP